MSRWILLALLAGILTGCSQYDLTVNEKVVYTPRPLLADIDIADDKLRACVEAAIVDQQVTRANELITLDCSDAEITSVAGLGVFTGLRELTLASNQISDLLPLAPLSSLENLDLQDNEVVDPVALYELLSLRYLNLAGNEGLQCPGSGALFQLEGLTLPAHCTAR